MNADLIIIGASAILTGLNLWSISRSRRIVREIEELDRRRRSLSIIRRQRAGMN